jgi:hypothetical protein
MGASLMGLIDGEVEPGGQDSTKKFLFFYDAPTVDLRACGYGQQPGHYGIIYLQNGSSCEGIGTSSVDYVAGHEATHVAGAVGSCAPHYGGEGHVVDTGSGHDLMNGGGTGNAAFAMVLDPGHDDYYGENVPAACFNLVNSPLLTTQSLSLLNAVRVSITGGENVGTVTVGNFGACVSRANPTRCAIYFPHGAPVTLSAAPAPGWSFSNWSNDLANCSNPCVVSSGNDIPIATAVFVPKAQATLAIYVSGQGTVTVNGATCSPCTVDAGSQVTLVAASAAGWHFSSWSGIDCDSSTCTTTLTSSKSVNVRFLPDNYTLTVSVVGRGTATVGAIGSCTKTCSFSIPAAGTTVVIEHPISGWTFKAWGGSAANRCDKLTCHIIPTRDLRLVATFVPKPKTKTKSKKQR